MGAAMTTMLSSSRLGLLFLLSAATLVSAAPLSASCRTIHPAADFSVEAYLGKWYIQQQMETKYLPKDRNYCVVAEYARKPKSLFGYDLDVHNRDQEADGTVHDSTKDTKGFGLCAKVVNATNGKLEVAPCFLPAALSGPYLGNALRCNRRMGLDRGRSADHPNHWRSVQDRQWSQQRRSLDLWSEASPK